MSGAAGVTVGRISVKVSPDTKLFRRELKRELDNVEKTLKGDVEVRAHLDGSQARADFARMKAQLQAEAAKGIKLRVDVDRSQLGSLAGAGAGVGAAGAESGLKGLGGVASAGPAVAIAAAVAAIAAAAPAVAVVSGALVALPGLLAAIAAPIGAISLGMDGIKAAAATLGPEFEAMKSAVSDTFAQSLGPVFEQLKAVMPTLTAGMQQIASGLSTAFGGIVNALTSGDGLKSLSTIFQNVGEAIAASAPGLEAFTGGLLKLAADFSTLFPGMAETFSSLGASFGAWATQMTTANSEGVTPLQTALKGLGEIVSSIGPALGQMFTQGLALLQNPQFITNVSSVVSALGTFANAVVTVSGAIGRLTPPIQVFMGLFGGIPAVFAAARGAVANAVAGIVGSVTAGFSGLVGIVQSAWSAVVGAIQAGISAAAGVAAGLGSAITGAVGDLSGLLVAAGKAVMDGLLAGLKAGWDAVAGWVSSRAAWIADHKGPISYDRTILVPHGEAIMSGLSEGLANGFDGVVGQVQGMAGKISDVFAEGIDGGFDWKSQFSDSMKTMTDTPFDFADATAKQAMGDIGMSGGGVAGALMDYGIGFAKQATGSVYNFNVSNVDDAISLKNNQTNREAQSYVGR